MDLSETIFVGIDVGGTNIKYGLIEDSGRIIASDQFPTQQELGPADAMKRSADAVRSLMKTHSISSATIKQVGLGTPGTMDLDKGLILEPPNLPHWRNFEIRDFLADEIRIPVAFTNDANAAAAGEFWIGAGQDFSSLVLLTLGTGVGGGIIINDFLIEGANSLGAECGHIPIDFTPDARECSCGLAGHLEAYASATAVVERYLEKLGNQLCDPAPTAREIATKAENGDPIANKLVDETAEYLARGIATFAHVIDPEIFLLGGAMNFGGSESDLGARFLHKTLHTAQSLTLGRTSKNLKIQFARLGGEAGWIGAAGIARRNYRQKREEAIDLQ